MQEVLYESSGPLRYSRTQDGGYKLVVEVEQDISDYYRSLVPKWMPINQQRYGAHISVVRKETPANLEVWGKYEGEPVVFHYSPVIHWGAVYYWLNVFSSRLEEIRLELGLPVSSEYTRPPDGWVKCFHTTIGNRKVL